MIFSTLILLQSLLQTPDPGKITLFIRGGQVVETTQLETRDRGLMIGDTLFCSWHVIDSIRTSESDQSRRLVSAFPGTTSRPDSMGFLLLPGPLSVKPLSPDKDRVFSSHLVSVRLSHQEHKRIGFALISFFQQEGGSFLEFGSSMGFGDETGFFRPNIARNEMRGVCIEVGAGYDFSLFQLSATVGHYSYNYEDADPGEIRMAFKAFKAVEFLPSIWLTGGLEYYPQPVTYRGTESFLGIVAGIQLNPHLLTIE